MIQSVFDPNVGCDDNNPCHFCHFQFERDQTGKFRRRVKTLRGDRTQKRQRRKDKMLPFVLCVLSRLMSPATVNKRLGTVARRPFAHIYRSLLLATSHDELDPEEQQKVQKYINGLKRKHSSKTSIHFSASLTSSEVGSATLLSVALCAAVLVL